MNERIVVGGSGLAAEDRTARVACPNFTAGEALIQPSLNRISIGGRVAQVEPKVMQVLVLMAEQPGTVVPRETFFETVWAGTIADDYLLNRAVSELRKVLADDAQAPRYIETIRKGGYRFIAPMAPGELCAAAAPAATRRAGELPQVDPVADRGSRIASTARRAVMPLAGALPTLRSVSDGYGWAAAGVLVAAAVVALFNWRTSGNAPDVAATYELRPLTSFVGRELEPALSPDGTRVAFIWDNGGGPFDVYVKTIGSEDVLNLTSSTASERYPLWSADGRALLFARSDGSGMAIMRVSSLGGGVTRVFSDEAAADIRGMSLSPDGTHLAYAARDSAASPYRIVLATLPSGERRIVSTPAPGSLGDMDPRFARDSRSIVFVRAVNEVTRDVYRVSPDGGEPTRLTFDNRKINGVAWSPGGERLLFTSTRSGMYGVWSADADGGDLRPVSLGTEDVHQPATATGVDAIAFEQWMHRSRLRQIDLGSRTELDADRYIQSTRWSSNPAWSPDGNRIAFTSNRSGPHSIWVSGHDGREAVQVANFGGAFVDNPAWSPDGARIAFDGSPEGRTAIFVVSPEGGAPQRIVDGPGDNRNPGWSRDGAWLYFESNRDGEWRIYARPATGGADVAITGGSGVNPRESADGSRLLYTKPDAPGLWQRPREDWREGAATRPEGPLTAELGLQDGTNWVPGHDGIYFVRRPAEGAPVLSLFAYERVAITDIVTLSPAFEGWGFDLSPDQARIIFSELMTRESDLRLAVPRRGQE